jgi:hypothetical protein
MKGEKTVSRRNKVTANLRYSAIPSLPSNKDSTIDTIKEHKKSSNAGLFSVLG